MNNKFIFGTATAAFQCEGATKIDGRSSCVWDTVLENGRAVHQYDPSYASDFYHQFEIDFKLAQEYGIQSMRVSIGWSRVFPKNNHDVNQLGVDYYHKMFKSMLDHNILPMVTLHHLDSPQWIVDQGDFLNRQTICDFVKYAEFCFKEFQEITMWGTINEIASYASAEYLKKAIAPYGNQDYVNFIQAQHNMLVAHAKVTNLFHKLGHKGKIGLPNWNNMFVPINDTEQAKLATHKVNSFWNWFSMEAILLGYYTKETLQVVNDYFVVAETNWQFVPAKKDLEVLAEASKVLDWFGINYYLTYFVDKPDDITSFVENTTGEQGTGESNIAHLYKTVNNPNVETTDWDWPIYPKGLALLIERAWETYGFKKEIYITENGYAQKETLPEDGSEIKDTKRIKYIQDHFNTLAVLRAKGINVAGYYLWSHMDMLSWTNGYRKRYGLFFVDFKTQKRYVKQSAKWWKEKSESGILTETEKSKELGK